jgi:hypothetical protein
MKLISFCFSQDQCWDWITIASLHSWRLISLIFTSNFGINVKKCQEYSSIKLKHKTENESSKGQNSIFVLNFMLISRGDNSVRMFSSHDMSSATHFSTSSTSDQNLFSLFQDMWYISAANRCCRSNRSRLRRTVDIGKDGLLYNDRGGGLQLLLCCLV